jgi:hypothetical protein
MADRLRENNHDAIQLGDFFFLQVVLGNRYVGLAEESAFPCRLFGRPAGSL